MVSKVYFKVGNYSLFPVVSWRLVRNVRQRRRHQIPAWRNAPLLRGLSLKWGSWTNWRPS